MLTSTLPPKYSLYVNNNLIANSSPNNYNNSYLPLCQLACCEYSNYSYYIINNWTGEIVSSN